VSAGADRLAPFLARERREEISHPAPLSDLLGRLEEEAPDLAPLAALVREKHRLILARKIVESEELWRVRRSRHHRRALLLVGLLGSAGAVFQKALEPVTAISIFCAGIAASYLVGEVLSSLGSAKDKKELAALEAKYREFLERAG
jgi:hypothetical protein